LGDGALWNLTFDEAVARAEEELAREEDWPEYGRWSAGLDQDARDLLGDAPIPEGAGLDVRAEDAAGRWSCPFCGEDSGWDDGGRCLACAKVVVPF
jgi:hypothetical protein